MNLHYFCNRNIELGYLEKEHQCYCIELQEVRRTLWDSQSGTSIGETVLIEVISYVLFCE